MNPSIRRRAFAFLPFLVLLVLAPPAGAVPLLDGLGGPAGYGEGSLAVDVPSSGPIDVTPAFPDGLRFFGRVYRTIWVNLNGTVSLQGPVTQQTPSAFPLAGQPMIAPWWAGVDLRAGGAPARNAVYWHLASGRLVVTWHKVGYFSMHDDLVNTFQVILSVPRDCLGPNELEIEFRYQRCDWTTGDASGGMGGQGGTAAQVGFDAGDLRNYVMLPMSRRDDIRTVCTTSNVPGGAPGRYRFVTRASDPPAVCVGAGNPCTVPGQVGRCALGIHVCEGALELCRQVFSPGEPRCNGQDNDCDGAPDLDSSLCPSGQVCDDNRCAPPCQFGADAGCAAGQACTGRNTCVESSCARARCAVSQRCSWGSCVDPCSGFICPRGQSCWAGHCLDPCTLRYCRTGEVCVAGSCLPSCHCRACPSGERCMPDGRCLPEGCPGVDCGPGGFCAGGRCHDACEHDPRIRMCPEGERCRSGRCEPGTDPPAAADAGVPDGGYWRPDTGDLWAFPPYSGCACRAGRAGAPGSAAAWAIVALAGIVGRRRRCTTAG